MLSIKTNIKLLSVGWIVFMIIGFIAERRYESILFYIFAICYFVALMALLIVREIK